MAKQIERKLKWLEEKLPEGLLVDAAWLEENGFSSALRHQYVKSGWLEQPSHGVYRKPRGKLTWQQAVISLQTLLLRDAYIVGGRTSLELQGYAHYLSQKRTIVHLYGPKKPPGWLNRLPLDVQFIYHNDKKLFRNEPITIGLGSLTWDVSKGIGTNNDPLRGMSTAQIPWGQWEWPLTLSSVERAVLELLDELPDRESFHQVDMLMEGMTSLSPRRLQKLLVDCSNVKVKRLFFFFADRHKHAWLKHLKKDQIDFGSGDRMLVKKGKYNAAYQITVPGDLRGV